MMTETFKRVTLFAGHYGSGKTNIAVNYAFRLRAQGIDVSLADIDIVNPYYRAKDSEKELLAAGIPLICSEYANSNVDVPALPDSLYSIVDQKDRSFIIDVGGDDRGALALGRFAPAILAENDYEMLLVLNASRPMTSDIGGLLEVKAEIESACRLPFTGIVNNTHLGDGTTARSVLDAYPFAEEASRRTGLPIRFNCVKEDLLPELEGKLECLMPLRLQNVRLWK